MPVGPVHHGRRAESVGQGNHSVEEFCGRLNQH
jgi:hypothetical protein